MYDYKSVTVIGVCINLPVIKVHQKAFDHSYSEDMSFCPKTGRPLWDSENLPAFTENDLPQYIHCYPDELENLNGDVYIGFVLCETHSNGGLCIQFTKLPKIKKLKKDLKSFLMKYDCWDPKKFGVYSVLDEC